MSLLTNWGKGVCELLCFQIAFISTVLVWCPTRDIFGNKAKPTLLCFTMPLKVTQTNERGCEKRITTPLLNSMTSTPHYKLK